VSYNGGRPTSTAHECNGREWAQPRRAARELLAQSRVALDVPCSVQKIAGRQALAWCSWRSRYSASAVRISAEKSRAAPAATA